MRWGGEQSPLGCELSRDLKQSHCQRQDDGKETEWFQY